MLEAEWNAKLRDLATAQETYERQRKQDRRVPDDAQRAEILSLATDFPRLWRDPRTSDRDRKRMVQLILGDVTLLRGTEITAHVRFRGGASRSLTLPLPQPAWRLRQTDPQVVRLVDQLLDEHTDRGVAANLNARGLRRQDGRPFDPLTVLRVRRGYGLKDRFLRLRSRGLLTLREMATLLQVSPTTVKIWRRRGLLPAEPVNDKGECLYLPPAGDGPAKFKHKLRRNSAAAEPVV